MRNFKNLPESQAASIQKVIDRLLEWSGRVTSLARFEDDFSHWLKQNILHRIPRHEVEGGNLYIMEKYIPVRLPSWSDPVTSEQAIEKRGHYGFKTDESSWKLNSLFTETNVRDLFSIFHFYASDDELKKFYKSQDAFIQQVEKRIRELKVDDPHNPQKSISKHFNQIAKELSSDTGIKFNVERIFEYVANNPQFSELESVKFTSDLKTAVKRAMREFKVEDRQSLFQAAAKIMDGQGYDFNSGHVKLYFAKMVSREEQYQLIAHLPQNYEHDGSRSTLGIQSAKDIKPVDNTSVAYAEDVARGGKIQSSSLDASPYADKPKTGRQRFSFRNNFE